MEYKIGKDTAKLLDAFRKLEESYELAYDALTDVYGEEQTDKLVQPLLDSVDKTKEELFRFVQTFVELSLAQTESYNEDKTEVTL